jgi:hypothetical protein
MSTLARNIMIYIIFHSEGLKMLEGEINSFYQRKNLHHMAIVLKLNINITIDFQNRFCLSCCG